MNKLLIVLVSLVLLSGCREKEKVLRITTEPEFRELALILASAFRETSPGVSIRVYPGSLEESGDSTDLHLGHERISGMSWVMANSAIVSVFNSNHPSIQNITRYGADLKSLADVFRGNIKSWSDLHHAYPELPVSVSGLNREHPVAKQYYDFLNCTPDSSMQQVISPEILALIIANNPLALGFLPGELAYDGRTGFRRTGIYILPIDMDSSGTLSDTEYIFDNLEMLNKAVNRNSYPRELIMPVYLTPMDHENETRDSFIAWYRSTGKTACQVAGFLFPEFD